mmetsp:Transcript_21639/g.33102  ORF Transcript_21639/g.33102 Transcript_21639/m.33102 type:complete len:130 (-) Transcript_21639:51-440(-)
MKETAQQQLSNNNAKRRGNYCRWQRNLENEDWHDLCMAKNRAISIGCYFEAFLAKNKTSCRGPICTDYFNLLLRTKYLKAPPTAVSLWLKESIYNSFEAFFFAIFVQYEYVVDSCCRSAIMYDHSCLLA